MLLLIVELLPKILDFPDVKFPEYEVLMALALNITTSPS